MFLLALPIFRDPVMFLKAKLAKNSKGTSSNADGLALDRNPIHEEGLIVHMISVAATQVRESPISYYELFDKSTTGFKECDG